MSFIADNNHDPDNPNSCTVPSDAVLKAQNGVTLGVFVKEPVPGTVKTRLGKEIGLEASAQLYQLFVKDLVDRFQSLPDRFLVGYTPETPSAKSWVQGLFTNEEISVGNINFWTQPEGELGDRMIAFFDYAFEASGVDSVVLIGSDSPTIPREYLLQAFEWLYQKDCVIGPSSDGGYYLIGLRRSCKELFQGIRWSQSDVLSQTLERIQQAGLSLKLLPVWYDVDSRDDLKMLQGHLSALMLTGEQDIPLQTSDWLANWKSVSP